METKTILTLVMLALSWAMALPTLQGLANLTFTLLSIAYVVMQMRRHWQARKEKEE